MVSGGMCTLSDTYNSNLIAHIPLEAMENLE